MTRLLDRLSNQQLNLENLSGHILPGRYLLLEGISVNNHSKLSAGTVLAGDGSNILKVNERTLTCSEQIEEDQLASHKFGCLAIQQIVKGLTDSYASLPSPLLPSQLFSNEGVLNKLEELLAGILEKGHLHEISRRPRYDMRYDEMVQPVSRTKRLASSSHRHLAAHSECWQARTLTGIQPKKILGLVSEDEYNLYENKVFARLIDRLERFLDKRLREITQLQKNLNDALDIEGSEALDYRLSKKLFALWGETFTSDAALSALDTLENTRLQLERQLKTVRGFIQGALYKRIPRNAQVSGRLQATNILAHDQHYRHLLTLWNTLQVESKRDNLTPAETMELNQQLQTSYHEYCRMIVVRALEELHYTIDKVSDGCYHFSRLEREIQLRQTDALGWELTDKIFQTSIILVPVFTWDSQGLSVVRNEDSITIPCCPHGNKFPKYPSQWLTEGFDEPLILSPMDFYVEERVVSLLNYWLLSDSIRSYGQPVEKIPTETMGLLTGLKGLEAAGAHAFRILNTISDSDFSTLENSLKKNNAQASLQSVYRTRLAILQLTHCPACNSAAEFLPRNQSTFIGRCRNSSCEMEWTISHTGSERHFKQYIDGDKSNAFIDSGRWVDQVVISRSQESAIA